MRWLNQSRTLSRIKQRISRNKTAASNQTVAKWLIKTHRSIKWTRESKTPLIKTTKHSTIRWPRSTKCWTMRTSIKAKSLRSALRKSRSRWATNSAKNWSQPNPTRLKTSSQAARDHRCQLIRWLLMLMPSTTKSHPRNRRAKRIRHQWSKFKMQILTSLKSILRMLWKRRVILSNSSSLHNKFNIKKVHRIWRLRRWICPRWI